MKKIILILVIIIMGSSLFAYASRLKLALTNYSPTISDYDAKNCLYRLNGRLDFLYMSSRLGAGSQVNVTFKSDHHDVDYYNYYDFYLHNFFGDQSDSGDFFVYGLVMGMRLNKARAKKPEDYGKITTTFTSFLAGALVSRQDWGMELMLTQNHQNNWKLDVATKYNFSGIYYVEIGYCTRGAVPEIEEDFSISFGVEFYN